MLQERDKKRDIRKKESESDVASTNVATAEAQLESLQARLNDSIRMRDLMINGAEQGRK